MITTVSGPKKLQSGDTAGHYGEVLCMSDSCYIFLYINVLCMFICVNANVKSVKHVSETDLRIELS